MAVVWMANNAMNAVGLGASQKYIRRLENKQELSSLFNPLLAIVKTIHFTA